MRKRSFFYDLPLRAPSKKRFLHTNLPFDSVVGAVRVVLRKMRANIVQTTNDSSSITAYKGWSLISDGEVITILIKQTELEQGCEIFIQSESVFPKLFDLGVNNRNLNRFEGLLRMIENNPGNMTLN